MGRLWSPPRQRRRPPRSRRCSATTTCWRRRISASTSRPGGWSARRSPARVGSPVLRRFRALHPPRVLALHLASDQTLPVPQPRELAAAAHRALATLARSDVCDLRNGRLLVELDRDPAEFTAYAVRSLLRPAPDKPLPSPPDSRSSGLVGFEPGGGSGRFLLLLEDGGESDERFLRVLRLDIQQCEILRRVLHPAIWCLW
uniref:Uncharacterized protein n=1 Tax=Arundo donax TaxID=35708 RepID=A0A0A9GMG5_ARUDO